MDEAAIRRFTGSLEDAGPFTGPQTAVAQRLPQLTGAAAHDLLEWQNVAFQALAIQVLGEPGAPLAAALVQGDRTCQVFDQECCEELGWFVERLRRDLAGVTRPWVAVLAPDATSQGGAFATYETLNRPPRLPVRRLVYYTETRGPTVASVTTGAVHVDDGQARLVSLAPVRPDDAGLLGEVLRGHPDRRRHRLPRAG